MKKYHFIAIGKKSLRQFAVSAIIALIIIYVNILYFSGITSIIETSAGFFDIDLLEIFNFTNY